jgi:hypothetical protein
MADLQEMMGMAPKASTKEKIKAQYWKLAVFESVFIS